MTTPLVNTERALSDLKRGLPVIITDGRTSLLCTAAENIAPAMVDLFLERPSRLILSYHRAAYICKPKPEHAITTAFTRTIHDELSALLWEKDLRQGYQLIHPTHAATELETHTLKSAELAELLPAIIATATIYDQDRSDYLCVSTTDLLNYTDQYAQDLAIICETPIVLEGNIHGRISAFRAPGSAKEHYAITIGMANALPTIPLVRIHSACYTGDLLQSMTCDCRDQLHAAITQIHRQGGGIILYLMQEGRNIGLINKLRAYALKASGLDTVDANYALGFEDDARTFQAGASMLRLLGYPTIRLLTSNPRKAENLTRHGIIVTDTVSHNMESNPYNQDYLSTKIDRLGHTAY